MAAERSISDGDVARLRRLHRDEGWSAADLAAEFGVTPQHVRRLVREDQRPVIAGLDGDTVRSGVAGALEDFLADADLPAGDAVLAATARTLASKLDAAGVSETAAAAQAAPRLAAELVAWAEGPMREKLDAALEAAGAFQVEAGRIGRVSPAIAERLNVPRRAPASPNRAAS